MSRFRKRSHAIWPCQYPLVWTPRYRFRTLSGPGAEAVELNVQIDHVHLLVMIPPKISVSDYVGTVKGRTAIRVFASLQPVLAFKM